MRAPLYENCYWLRTTVAHLGVGIAQIKLRESGWIHYEATLRLTDPKVCPGSEAPPRSSGAMASRSLASLSSERAWAYFGLHCTS